MPDKPYIYTDEKTRAIITDYHKKSGYTMKQVLETIMKHTTLEMCLDYFDLDRRERLEK
jgi:hypothetical protein